MCPQGGRATPPRATVTQGRSSAIVYRTQLRPCPVRVAGLYRPGRPMKRSDHRLPHRAGRAPQCRSAQGPDAVLNDFSSTFVALPLSRNGAKLKMITPPPTASAQRRPRTRAVPACGADPADVKVLRGGRGWSRCVPGRVASCCAARLAGAENPVRTRWCGALPR
ncbi:MAG: hypothetical protein JWM45_4134 [Pseudonocardiales bacterium]|nr:hypothetical protein [Pseudonocardiales bacterium]